MTRPAIFRLVLAAAIAVVLTGSAATSAGASCGGAEYPDPSGSPLSFAPSDVVAGHDVGFSVDMNSYAATVEGSGHFEFDGPAGHASVPADAHLTATYAPPVPGHYTVYAAWTAYNCGDGQNSTFWSAQSVVASFDARAPEPPTVSFKRTRRPKSRNSLGDATFLAFVNCPAPSQAGSEDVVETLYYRFGSKRPNHKSKHLRLKVPGGCDGLHSVKPKHKYAKRYSLVLNRDQVFVTAVTGVRLRALVEVRAGGKLIGTGRATFRPSRRGEKVYRR